MNVNPPDDPKEARPLDLMAGFRYLLRDAVRDFNAAISIGRKRQSGQMTAQEFAAAIEQRFPPPGNAP